jgi:hypothetical protein
MAKTSSRRVAFDEPALKGVSRPVGKTGTVVLSILLSVAVLLLSVSRGAYAKERTALVTVSVKLASPPSAETVRLWMPYPMSDGKPLNEDLYGFNLGYTIRFKEL